MRALSRLALQGRSHFQGISERSSTGFRLIVVAALAMLITLSISSRLGQTQLTREATLVVDSKPTIHAAQRGNPEINLRDGYELAANFSGNAVGNNSQASLKRPQSLAAADFDEDGTRDLVCGYEAGKLALYRGNADSRAPHSRAAQQHKAQGTFTSEPFLPIVETMDLPESAELVAGDFNADGHQDILAYSIGGNTLFVLAGSGRGTFGAAQEIKLAGRITAVASGEIGRADGLMDLAVAITNEKGPQLLVFEYPEGAFKHKPEVFKLAAPATSIALGNLDNDFYADIAVAAGNDLTIIHERGQAYPWDLIRASGIKRPAAAMATRRMPFTISALAVGKFDEQRGDSLAMLGGDGNVYQLAPTRTDKTSINKLSKTTLAQAKGDLFLPAGLTPGNLATIADAPLSQQDGEKLGLRYVDTAEVRGGRLNEFLKKKQDEQTETFKNADKRELARAAAEGLPVALERRERAKAAYLKSISARPSTLAKWQLQTLLAASRFSSLTSSGNVKMLRVNLSASNTDDLLLLDPVGSHLHIVTQSPQATIGNPQSEVVSLDVDGGPVAVLPMRLNADAFDDLVVLRQGSSVPSVVTTAASQIITVNSAVDDFGDCSGGGTCTLRSAIILANSSGGAAEIDFNIGDGGLQTIFVTSQLPIIVQPVIIDGTTQPGYNDAPSIEITGANLSGTAVDGLKIRTSDSFVRGLAINRFPSTVDSNTGSQTGGNGITIESTTLSPNSANNSLEANYLGTDSTGSLDEGNDATGVNIFDSTANQIGGPAPHEGNLISGNGSLQKLGAGIAVTAGNANTFQGNIIGLNSLGTGKLGNSQGLFFAGANNIFGGDEAGAGNTVSGNGEPRPGDSGTCFGFGMTVIPLVNLDTRELLTLDNTLKGNRFGTNPAGTQGLGNCSAAIGTPPLTQTIIGSITQNGRNIVSDNGLDAIYCTEFSTTEGGFCAIQGNNIGTDITGTIAIPNDWRNQLAGITVQTGTVFLVSNDSVSNFGAPGGTTPGGACTGFCNLLSGNGEPGSAFLRQGFGTVGVFSNFVGTNQNGTQSIPNVLNGIESFGAGITYVGLGDPDVPLGNLISGNGGAAVRVGSNSPGHYATIRVEANLISTDTSGNLSLTNNINNSLGGIGAIFATALFSDQISIGGTNFQQRNIIAGDRAAGISVNDLGGQTTIVNNLIGLNRSLQPLGNGDGGVYVSGSGTVLGGGTDQEGNQIANNGTAGNHKAGVFISGDANTVSHNLIHDNNAAGVVVVGGTANTIRNNSIYDNGGLGIDLANNGVTANDCHDFDTGANDLQNFPLLLDAPVFNPDGTVTATGAELSQPLEFYTIDFYASPSADPTNHGEGATYLGSQSVQTDDHGLATLNFTSSAAVPPSYVISATATDRFGSTSEFSCNAGATCSDTSPAEKTKNYRILAAVCFESEPIVVNIATDEPDEPQHLNQDLCDVDPNTDGSQCSLRAAIQVAEHRAGYDRIQFAIPGSGVQVISPTGAFLNITESVLIDGTTQTGYLDGSPMIELSGANAGLAVDGFHLKGQDIVIKGLIINRFSRHGVFIDGGAENTVASCFIGTTSTGNGGAGNKGDGIKILNSPKNLIGGEEVSSRNVISANGDEEVHTGNGVTISGAAATENDIKGCYIGTNAAGSAALGNRHAGVFIASKLNHVGRFPIQDDSPSSPASNLISGNEAQGVAVVGDSGNIVQYVTVVGNSIGTDYTGANAIPNQIGISFQNADACYAEQDTISGNSTNGVTIASSSNLVVIDNFIGTNKETTASLGHQINGVLITEGSHDNRIGGFVPAPANPSNSELRGVISGNLEAGVAITAGSGAAPYHNYVVAARIGTDKTGEARVPNLTGVSVQNSVHNVIWHNQISANTTGVFLSGASGGSNNVMGNDIGLNVDGSSALGNQDGVVISSSSNVVGVSQFDGIVTYGLTNYISGNTTGIIIRRNGNDPAPSGNIIQDTRLGLNETLDDPHALPNGIGILISDGAQNNRIGQTRAEGLNPTVEILSSSDAGIAIETGANPNDPPNNNRIETCNIGIANHLGTFPNQVGVRNSGRTTKSHSRQHHLR